MVWWGIAAAACAAALLAWPAGQGTWAAAATCLALGAVAVQQLRLLAARRELRRLRQDTELVLRSLSGGLITIDLEGRVTGCNPAAERILGLCAADLLGRGLTEAFGSRAPLLHGILQRSLRDGTPITRLELQVAQTGGDARPIGLSTSLLRAADGEGRGLLATFQDLSEVRRMQERVRRADRLAAVGQLAASIAHEIRNPLAAISNSIDMLRDELPVRGEQRRLMDLVVKEGERLNRILDDFLEYARARPLESLLVPVERALEEVVTLMRRHPDIGDDIQIVVEDCTGGATSCLDEAQMKQVYVNLALNAFEAMGHRGVLRITVDTCAGDEVGLPEAPFVRLSFRDTGPGIQPGQEASIFEPFHTTKPHGTGLGLSIAGRIVESHGGRIEGVTHPEGGAEFCVYLPHVAAEAAVASGGVPARSDEKPAGLEPVAAGRGAAPGSAAPLRGNSAPRARDPGPSPAADTGTSGARQAAGRRTTTRDGGTREWPARES